MSGPNWVLLGTSGAAVALAMYAAALRQKRDEKSNGGTDCALEPPLSTCDGKEIIVLHSSPRGMCKANLPSHKTSESTAKASDFDDPALNITRKGTISVIELAQAFTDSNRFITPYTVDRNRVICVEMGRHELESADDDCTFFYQKQRAYATMFYSVPLCDFIEACRSLMDIDNRVIFLHSTGRCGSTLLSSMIDCAGDVATISEPDFYTAMTILSSVGALENDLIRPLYAAATRLLGCNMLSLYSCKKVLIKFRSFVIQQGKEISDANPRCKNIYLYRNAYDTIDSFTVAFSPIFEGENAWIYKILGIQNFMFRNYNPVYSRFRKVFCPIAGNPEFQFPDDELYNLGIKGILTLGWLDNVHRALELSKNSSFWSAVIRYDELKQCDDKAALIAELLVKCGLDNSIEIDQSLLRVVLGKDAHRGGRTKSKRRVSSSDSFQTLSVADLKSIKSVLAAHPEIRHSGFKLESTLSCL